MAVLATDALRPQLGVQLPALYPVSGAALGAVIAAALILLAAYTRRMDRIDAEDRQ